MKKRFFVFGIAAAVILSIFTSMPVNAEKVSFDSKEVETKISGLIEKNKDSTPSAAIAVFDENDDIYSIFYGKSDIENNISAKQAFLHPTKKLKPII